MENIDNSEVQKLLQSGEEKDRKLGIVQLAKVPTREALFGLEKIAEDDESLEVRFFARRAIGCVKALFKPVVFTESAPPIEISKNFDFQKASESEKLQVLQEIINRNLKQHLPFLLANLKKENSPQIISALLMAIAKFGNEQEINVLLHFLNHTDSRVRANCIEALEFIGSLKVYPHIFPLLKDADNRVRANAIRAIKNIDSVTSLRILKAMIASNNVAFQASSAYLFRFLPAEPHVNLLAPLLKSRNEAVKRNARDTLKIFNEKGISRAASALEEIDHPNIDSLSIETLDTIENELSRPRPNTEILMKAFETEDAKKRLEEIEQAVQTLGESAGKPLLEHLPRENDNWVIGKIFMLFGKLRFNPAVKELLNGLKNPDSRCRANAVEALGQIGKKESLRKLIPFLKDENNRIRGNAIIALKDEVEIDIATSLSEMVKAENELMQRTAVFVIGEIEISEFYPFLQALEVSQYPEVKKAAKLLIKGLRETRQWEPEPSRAAETSIPEISKEITVEKEKIESAPVGVFQAGTRTKEQLEEEINEYFSQEPDKALAALDELIEIDPQNNWAWISKGTLLYRAKRYDEAAESLIKSLELEQTDTACFYLALSYSFLQNTFDTLRYFSKAEELYRPNGDLNIYEDIYVEKGIFLCDIGRYDEAEKLLQKCYDVLEQEGACAEVLRLSKPNYWLNKCREAQQKKKDALKKKTALPAILESPAPMPPPVNMVACRWCREQIVKGAMKCKHCGEFQRDDDRKPGGIKEIDETDDWNSIILGVVGCLIGMIIPLVNIIVIIFLAAEGLHVLITMISSGLTSAILAFVPFGAPYFVWTRRHDLFENKNLAKVWAIISLPIYGLFLIGFLAGMLGK